MRSNQLHEFIHNLRQSEKRYLSVHLNNDATEHAKMFRLISSQRIYNETLLKSHFPNNKFQLTKNYLFKSIIKLLADYDFKEHDLDHYLTAFKVLFKRFAFSECVMLLKKLNKLAIQQENYLAQLTIIGLCRQIFLVLPNPDKDLIRIIQEEEEVSKKQKTVSGFQAILMKLSLMETDHGSYQPKENLKIARNLKEDSYLKIPFHNLDQLCKQFYHEIHLTIASMLNDRKKFKEHAKELHLLIDNPEYDNYSNEHRKNLILIKLMRINHSFSEWDQLQLNVTSLKNSLERKSIVDPVRLVSYYSQIHLAQMVLFLALRYYEKALSYITDEIDPFLTKYENFVGWNTIYLFRANRILVHFGLSNYKVVLRYINDFLISKRYEQRKDILISIQLIELLSFYELGMMDLIESRLPSYTKLAENEKDSTHIWLAFADFFKSVLQEKDIQLLIKSLNKKLQQEKSNANKLQKVIMDWIRSKA